MNLNPLDMLPGWKTYAVAVGLIGLGVYQASTGQIETAIQSIMTGLGMIFARRAVDRP